MRLPIGNPQRAGKGLPGGNDLFFAPPPRGESKSKHITSSENVDRLKKIKIHLFLRCNLHILFAIGWFKEVLTVTAFWVGGSRLSLFFQREFLAK